DPELGSHAGPRDSAHRPLRPDDLLLALTLPAHRRPAAAHASRAFFFLSTVVPRCTDGRPRASLSCAVSSRFHAVPTDLTATLRACPLPMRAAFVCAAKETRACM